MYKALEDLIREEQSSGIPFWKLVQKDDCKEQNKSEEQSFQEMQYIYRSMRSSFEEYDAKLLSASGLVGGEGARLQLTQLADTIKAAFDDLQVVCDGKCFHVFYNTMQWIPTGDDDLDRIDVSLLTNIWKG